MSRFGYLGTEFKLLDFRGFYGNADPASPLILPMSADGARIFFISFGGACVCFGCACVTLACARGDGLSIGFACYRGSKRLRRKGQGSSVKYLLIRN